MGKQDVQENINAILSQGVQRDDVPDMVAMVPNWDGIVYEETFSERARKVK